MCPDVSIKTFLDTIFSDPIGDERIALTLDKEGWTTVAGSERWYSKLERTRGTGAWYFCVSTVRGGGEYLGRGKADLRYAYCLVLDDIMTKAVEPPVAPSWVLESSAGNFQYGYLLDPIELTPQTMAYYDGCVAGLALAGYSDPGARGAYRVMRLPGSLHRTGFVARLTAWAPDRHWALEDLMAQMGVEPRKMRASLYSVAPSQEPISDGRNDAVLQWLRDNNYVTGGGGRWIDIICPWHEEHTTGSNTAGYSPAPGRAFSCLHTHEYSTNDFLAWVKAQGGPDPAAPQQRDITPALFNKIYGEK